MAAAAGAGMGIFRFGRTREISSQILRETVNEMGTGEEVKKWY